MIDSMMIGFLQQLVQKLDNLEAGQRAIRGELLHRFDRLLELVAAQKSDGAVATDDGARAEQVARGVSDLARLQREQVATLTLIVQRLQQTVDTVRGGHA